MFKKTIYIEEKQIISSSISWVMLEKAEIMINDINSWWK